MRIPEKSTPPVSWNNPWKTSIWPSIGAMFRNRSVQWVVRKLLICSGFPELRVAIRAWMRSPFTPSGRTGLSLYVSAGVCAQPAWTMNKKMSRDEKSSRFMISSLLLFFDPAEALFLAVAEVTDGFVFLAVIIEHELNLDFAVVLRDKIRRAERNQPEFRSFTTSALILASRAGGLAVSSLPWAKARHADQEKGSAKRMMKDAALAFFCLN